jgi:hypothetical protein
VASFSQPVKEKSGGADWATTGAIDAVAVRPTRTQPARSLIFDATMDMVSSRKSGQFLLKLFGATSPQF